MLNGEENLEILLKSINPVLDSREFVFCNITENDFPRIKTNAICWFKEKEGITLILEKSVAEKNNMQFIYPCKMITLNVHSNLNAVGFLAAVAAKLAEHQISVNTVSAFYHDHLFVSVEKAEQAMQILLKGFTDAK